MSETKWRRSGARGVRTWAVAVIGLSPIRTKGNSWPEMRLKMTDPMMIKRAEDQWKYILNKE